MLQWLKVLLRRWLEIQDSSPPPVDDNYMLEAMVPVKGLPTIVRFRIVGARGLHLVGVPENNAQGVRLIGQYEAVDHAHWTKLWRRFTPDADKWTWSDGTPFTTGENE